MKYEIAFIQSDDYKTLVISETLTFPDFFYQFK